MSLVAEQLYQRRLRNQQVKRYAFQQPIPEATRTYGPVANQELYEVVTERVRQHGLTIVDEEFMTALKGQVTLCKLHINTPENPDVNRTFAFLNSYNKMRKVTFASGAVVMACWNGMFIGDEGSFSRRHYRNVWDDIHAAVDTQVNKMSTNFGQLMEFKRRAEQQMMHPSTAAGIAGQMYFRDIISPRMLSDIKNEIHNSNLWSFDKDEDGELLSDTVWKFYNNCTEAVKRAPAMDYVRTHAGVTKYLVDHFGFNLN